jgi:hypothetical protein
MTTMKMNNLVHGIAVLCIIMLWVSHKFNLI